MCFKFVANGSLSKNHFIQLIFGLNIAVLIVVQHRLHRWVVRTTKIPIYYMAFF
jgi:hypothetical protein